MSSSESSESSRCLLRRVRRRKHRARVFILHRLRRPRLSLCEEESIKRSLKRYSRPAQRSDDDERLSLSLSLSSRLDKKTKTRERERAREKAAFRDAAQRCFKEQRFSLSLSLSRYVYINLKRKPPFCFGETSSDICCSFKRV